MAPCFAQVTEHLRRETSKTRQDSTNPAPFREEETALHTMLVIHLYLWSRLAEVSSECVPFGKKWLCGFRLEGNIFHGSCQEVNGLDWNPYGFRKGWTAGTFSSEPVRYFVSSCELRVHTSMGLLPPFPLSYANRGGFSSKVISHGTKIPVRGFRILLPDCPIASSIVPSPWRCIMRRFVIYSSGWI